jgi:methylaspartate ammonia-lyase
LTSRVADVIAVPIVSGFFSDDQAAIREGRTRDGFRYLGDPVTPGFHQVRQPGEALSVLIVADDGAVAHGDGASVQYSAAGGREGPLSARSARELVQSIVAPALIGRSLDGFRPIGEEVEAISGPDGEPLPAAIRYGVSQALLDAVAQARRCTMAEVIRDEWATGAALAPVPIFAQSGDDRYTAVDKMALREVDVLPHGLINNVAEKLGEDGELFKTYVAWVRRRVIDTATRETYRPVLHFDTYGTIGLAFGGDLDAVASYLVELEAVAAPLRLRIEHPVDAGSTEAQISAFVDLRRRLAERGSSVEIVVDEWCNTLSDIRRFIDARAADVIHVKTPDLGGIGNTIEALLLARAGGLGAYCGGTCNETDRSAQVSAHIAMACDATQVLAKPGMGVDEGVMIVANEMARTAALCATGGARGRRRGAGRPRR